jgi:hypothetical protein
MNKFKEAEAKYREIKLQLDRNEINADEMKKMLKDIMVKDEGGNYWMIGGKTGKWYTFQDSEWKEDDPYKEAAVETQRYIKEDQDVGVFQEDEAPMKLEDSSLNLCRFCKSRIAPHSVYCHICGANQKETERTSTVKLLKGESELGVKSIKFLPMIFFFGGLGLILGILFGATFGIFNILGDLIYQFPVMLQETRGKIQGGLIFAAMGGIGGYIVFAFFSIAITAIYNFISFFFGGLRFKTRT